MNSKKIIDERNNELNDIKIEIDLDDYVLMKEATEKFILRY